jgi:hypothetical protein
VYQSGRRVGVDAVLEIGPLLAAINQADMRNRCLANQICEVDDVNIVLSRLYIHWIASLRNR